MPPEPNDPLDALLRENDAYVDDGGFTSRVMASLPPRRRRSSLRPVILFGSILIGLALMVWFLPTLMNDLNLEVGDDITMTLNAQSVFALGALLAGIASLAWGFFTVVRSED